MPLRKHAAALEAMYRRYNRRQYVHPDPVEFLYEYPDPADREIVALVASSLAYGRVEQILKSVRRSLDRMTEHPARFARDSTPRRLGAVFGDFKHRFTTGAELAALLAGAGKLLARQGSLERAFGSGTGAADETVLPALTALTESLRHAAGAELEHLLPRPARGGACKRLHLMLRWLVRSDQVDVGAWRSVPPARLLVPLDTHMRRIGRALGAARRSGADLRMAVEITAAFRRVQPEDPVRYDFSLTRVGIHPAPDLEEFLRTQGLGECLKAGERKGTGNRKRTARHPSE